MASLGLYVVPSHQTFSSLQKREEVYHRLASSRQHTELPDETSRQPTGTPLLLFLRLR